MSTQNHPEVERLPVVVPGKAGGVATGGPAPVLQVRGLSKTFRLHLRGGLQLPVLAGVHLNVAAGECLALVGASGRGKSTLLKCLYGAYGIDAGQALFHPVPLAPAIDLAQATPQQVLALRRQALAYVSQFLRAMPRVGALDLVAERWMQASSHRPDPVASTGEGAVGASAAAADPAPEDEADHAHRLREARAAAGALLARLNLPRGLWDLPPATFSGGEQQRVNIARGLVAPARLLLLDEPTASLDADNRRAVVALVREQLAAGCAVVGIFHDEAVRDALAHRCLTMEALQTLEAPSTPLAPHVCSAEAAGPTPHLALP